MPSNGAERLQGCVERFNEVTDGPSQASVYYADADEAHDSYVVVMPLLPVDSAAVLRLSAGSPAKAVVSLNEFGIHGITTQMTQDLAAELSTVAELAQSVQRCQNPGP